MQIYRPTSFRQTKVLAGSLFLLLLGLGVYLIAFHYLKTYSDPVGWCRRGAALMAGVPVTHRAFLYPLFLGIAMKAVGTTYVFLVNIPWVLMLTWLTYRLTREVFDLWGGTDGGVKSQWAGLFACTLLVVQNCSQLLLLVNPYREAMAFSLILASMLFLLRFLNGGAYWLTTCSALFLGLAVSTRETALILIFPVVFCFAGYWIADRRRRWVIGALWYVAPMFLGLIPFFIQNYLHTGHFWLPGYAATRLIEGGKLQIPTDIPIPGMSFDFFGLTGKEMFVTYLSRYHWIGVALIFICLGYGVLKRQKSLLLLSLPFLLLNGLFYSCYRYYKDRYFFIMDPFLCMMVAGGAVVLGDYLLTVVRFSTWRKASVISMLAALCLPVFAGYTLVRNGVAKGERMQVWDVPALRAFLLPDLEEPYTFTGRTHYRDMMAWHLQGQTLNFEGHIRDFSNYKKTDIVYEMGMDKFLHYIGTNQIASVASRNLYFIGDEPTSLMRAWVSTTPVLSLKDAPVPVEHYGRRMNHLIQRVRVWDQKEVVRVLEGAKGSPSVLALDMRRIGDYDGRTFCELKVNGLVVPHEFVSATQFVPLPKEFEDAETLSIEIRSDAPLPSDPTIELFSLGDDFTIPLGANSRFWYYRYLGVELFRNSPFKEDACLLYEEGGMTLPVFAGEDQDVFATFHVEFLQQDKYFSSKPYTLTAESGGWSTTQYLPSPRHSGEITVFLGRGTGAWSMMPVRLESSLPSREDQKELGRQGLLRLFGAVKLSQAKIFARPAQFPASLTVDLGRAEDGVMIESGWFDREKSGSRSRVRWTSPHATLRLPIAPQDGSYQLLIHTRRVRPLDHPAEAMVEINGRPLHLESVQEDAENTTETYHLIVPEGTLNGGWDNRLTIRSTPWVPGDVGGQVDRRPLGMMIDRIELKPNS